MMKFGR